MPPEKFLPVIYGCIIVTVVGLLFSIAISSIAMASGMVLWIVYLARKGWSVFPKTPLDRIFLAYLAAETLATIFSIEPAASLVNMKRLLLILNLYIVLTAIDTDKKLTLIVGLIGVVSAGLTLFEIVTIPEIGGHFLRVSTFQYYLTEGGLKMIVLLMLMPFILHPQTPVRWRVLASAWTFILLVGLIITQTRSSWLGFLAGALRNPSAADGQRGTLLLGFALTEALGIFALLIALLLLFAV